MWTIFWCIVALGILIFIHELGHFMVAKLCDVRVETFSLGFGPRIVSFTRGETEYCISWIPFGGYVKMSGEEPEEEAELKELGDNDPRHFSSKPLHQRMMIVLAGPIMNLVLAVFIMPWVFMMGVETPQFFAEAPVLGWVAPGSPAQQADLKAGDQIVNVNQAPVETWRAFQEKSIMGLGKPVAIAFLRNGQQIETTMDLKDDPQNLGVHPITPAVIGSIAPGMPAAQAGMQAGDEIIEVGGQAVANWFDMAHHIQQYPEQTITIKFKRDGNVTSTGLMPQRSGESGYGIIGIGMPDLPTFTERYGFGQAIVHGTKRVWELTSLTFGVIYKLFTFQLSPKTLGGPIMIAQAAGAAAKSGVSSFLSLLAFISLQLGILNLLPIPVLDGGHFFFMLIEAARRGKPVSIKVRMWAQQIGVFMLLGLMALVTYQDILRTWDVKGYLKQLIGFFQ